MIENRTYTVPLSSIAIDREARQRSDISLESVFSLALSIAKHHWVSDLLLEKETNKLLAGERRFTAVRLLQMATSGEVPNNLTPEQITQLKIAAQSCPPAWKNWTKIPAKFGKDLTPLDMLAFEFIENNERKDLCWQDKAKAIYEIHTQGLKTSDVRWTGSHTGRLIGLERNTISQYLTVWKAQLKNDNRILQIIKESPSLLSALAAIDRVESRREEPLDLNIAQQPENLQPIKEQTHSPSQEITSEGEHCILNKNFHEFAASYSGPPFNFIHCDFPYGIEFNQSPGMHTAADVKQAGEYDDTIDVYWNLLSTLAKHQDQLISPSAHLMFWYSQNWEDETKEFFKAHFPLATLQKFKLIWHCSDNSGIVPDPQRYGRRTYETAFLLSFGDRKIVTSKALSYAFPRVNKEHRSQKPIEMLLHFFSMFVDENSRTFDPTCGSATSLIAAKKLNSRSVLGLEKDPETWERAVKYFDQET